MDNFPRWKPMKTAPKNQDILIFDLSSSVNHVYEHITYEHARVVQVFWHKEDGYNFETGEQTQGRWMPRTDRRPKHYTTAEVVAVCWMEVPDYPDLKSLEDES